MVVDESSVQIPQTPRSRIMMAFAFVPGVYIVLLLSAAITIAIGGGIIYFIWYVFSTLIHRIPVGLMYAIGVGVLIGVYGILKGIFRTIFRKADLQPALLIDLHKEPRLRSFIHDLCQEMGTQEPDSVIIHAEPTFFVTQGKMKVFDGPVKGRVLAIGLPLLGTLNTCEFKAILAHEFAHFTGNDTLYSTIVLPVYTGAITAMSEMRAVFNSEGDGRVLASLPLFVPYYTLKLYLFIFHRLNMKISRDRERRADTIAALTCGTESFSTGLRKVVGYGEAFSVNVTNDIVKSLKRDKGFKNYYRFFRENISDYAADIARFEDKARNEADSADSSHPTMATRLGYLPQVPEKCDNNEPALNVLERAEYYEEVLTEKYSRVLAYQYRYYLSGTLIETEIR